MQRIKLVVMCVCVSLLSGCFWNKNKQDAAEVTATKQPEMQATPSGLKFLILEPSADQAAEAPVKGSNVKVHYTGWVYDETRPEGKGAKFDSSVDRNRPFDFFIGKQHVIAGWDEGVMLMKKGEKRRLIIPADLGYGARGAGALIPPHATLVFDVELLDIKK